MSSVSPRACSVIRSTCATPSRCAHCGLRSAASGATARIASAWSAWHLAGLAALAPGAVAGDAVDFAVLGYPITSMETQTYRPARLILLGEDASPELRRVTSLDALVTPSSPPFFVWHTAEDPYVPPEHTYRLAGSLAANGVPHTTHVFAHGPHSLGLARGTDDAEAWTSLAASWIAEQTGSSARRRPAPAAAARDGSRRPPEPA
jgi:fermentation-respiration switch protein FrsA (DUF1100 family)